MKTKLITLLFICATVLLFPSCEKERDSDTNETLISQWVTTHVNGQRLPSDSISVNYYTRDFRVTVSQGQDTDGGSQWVINTDNCYHLEGNNLAIASPTPVSTTIKSTIRQISIASLVLSTYEIVADGASTPVNIEVAALAAINTNVQSSILGMWSAPSLSDANILEIWEFNSKGSVKYYAYDTVIKKYIKDITSGASYYVYGDYVVLNFPSTATDAEMYKVWEVESIEGRFLEWFNVDKDGKVAQMTLTSIGQLP